MILRFHSKNSYFRKSGLKKGLLKKSRNRAKVKVKHDLSYLMILRYDPSDYNPHKSTDNVNQTIDKDREKTNGKTMGKQLKYRWRQ